MPDQTPHLGVVVGASDDAIGARHDARHERDRGCAISAAEARHRAEVRRAKGIESADYWGSGKDTSPDVAPPSRLRAAHLAF